MQLLIPFIRLPWVDRLLLLEATVWLGVARLAIAIVPFRCVARHLGQPMAESAEVAAPADTALMQRISWAVTVMSQHLPWACQCLAQAIAAKRMLQSRDIPSTLYLGVAKNDENGLLAHAWLRSHDMILTGARGKDGYTIVATFADVIE